CNRHTPAMAIRSNQTPASAAKRVFFVSATATVSRLGQYGFGWLPHRASVCPDENGAGVGSEDNVFVTGAQFGPALGPPLAQANAVTVAVAFNEVYVGGIVDDLEKGAGQGFVVVGGHVDAVTHL